MKAQVSTSFNVRDGVLLVFHEGKLIYDGLPTEVPAAVVQLPGVAMLMHPHMKDRMDAGIKAREKAVRQEEAQRGKMLRLHNKGTIQ